ncbi:hypothetical protein ZWY2020_031730 [Hordeum vulgare]|nr:hypothetical protein ZWY2020_031730 [Hordeum vulgare]
MIFFTPHDKPEAVCASLRRLSFSDGGSKAAPLGHRRRSGEAAPHQRSGSRRWSRKKARARATSAAAVAAGSAGHRRMPWRSPVGRKRVTVVVDQSYGAKQSMMWALTHVANRGLSRCLVSPRRQQGSGRTPALPTP